MALNITLKDDNISEKEPKNRENNENVFVIEIDDANAYNESREDVMKRFKKITCLADEGKLEPPQEVKEFWEKVRKRKNSNAISDDNFNEGE